MTIREEVKRLLAQVPRAPGTFLPMGATTNEVDQFEGRLGREIPDNLRQWLQTCNGPCIGPGGIYGIPPARPPLLIESYLAMEASWIDRGWIPIAGDGCGNYYILDISQTSTGNQPVYFVDHEEAYDRAAYVVASDLWHFLRFLFRREMGILDWPFNKEMVVKDDPDLQSLNSKVPLPWLS